VRKYGDVRAYSEKFWVKGERRFSPNDLARRKAEVVI
jgi:hypothetical protein